MRDFAPITSIGKAPSILVVTPTLPVNSVKELIAYARARPGQLNNSVGGLGGGAHLAGELFKSMAGVNIVAVPYASDAQELTDLFGGRVHMTISTPASLMEHVKQGKLKALAVTTAEPSKLVPGLPTIAETLPGYESAFQVAMFAPAQTPDAIIKRLNQETVRVLGRPDISEKLFSLRIEAAGTSPEQLGAVVQSEIAKLGRLIKDLGMEIK